MSEIDWSKAPDGCTHCNIHEVGTKWWQKKGVIMREYVNGNWRERLYWPKSLIPRPTKQEWEGGLPPVGTVCECLFNDGWRKVAVLARHGSEFWVKRPRGTHIVSEGIGNRFRPLKSQHERHREELIALVHDAQYSAPDVADAILSRYNMEEKL